MPKEKNSALLAISPAQRRPRQFDHGPDMIGHRDAGLLGDRLRHGDDDRLDSVELGEPEHQRHHDLGGDRRASLAAGLDGAFENGARLHFGDLGEADRKPHAAEAEHWVELVQLGRARAQLAGADAHCFGDFFDLLVRLRQELVQRRVEQSDGDRQAGHDLEQFGEILPLHRQQLGERRAPSFLGVGEDHLAHRDDALALEEHVLGSAEADAFAPNDRATRASVGVSALARTFIRLTSSAQPMRVANSPVISGFTIGTTPCMTWPTPPSMVRMSPFFSVTPPAVIVCAA